MNRRLVAVALAAVLAAGTAQAQPASSAPPNASPATPDASHPSPEDRAAAAKEFKDGERAFQRGDYVGAAKLFESAYRHAPHHAPLWNAARAWERAGDLSRAATLYAKFLRDAPTKASGRESANTSLRELSKKLTRLEIAAPGMTDVKVDDHPTDELIVYVAPGTHVLEAREGDRVVRETQEAVAGITVGIALVAPPPSASGASPTAPPPSTASTPATTTMTTTDTPTSITVERAPRDTTPASHGWPPWVVIAGGAFTAVGLAATIASGIDTQNWKSNHYDPNPTQSNLDQGFNRERRTNVLLAVTIGAAAFTGVAAIWLVDWHKRGSAVEVGASLGGVVVRGAL